MRKGYKDPYLHSLVNNMSLIALSSKNIFWIPNWNIPKGKGITFKHANYSNTAWWYKVCLSCPYFSGKYGAPPTRTPKCIDENKNDICDSEEETEETTKDPVSVHNNFTYSESVEKHVFIWNLYLAISNLRPNLDRGKKFSK